MSEKLMEFHNMMEAMGFSVVEKTDKERFLGLLNSFGATYEIIGRKIRAFGVNFYFNKNGKYIAYFKSLEDSYFNNLEKYVEENT